MITLLAMNPDVVNLFSSPEIARYGRVDCTLHHSFFADTVLAVPVMVGMLLFFYLFWYHFPNQAELERAGLPSQDVFVNREQEQFDIVNALTVSGSDHIRIVTITGGPGHGKSALATVCGFMLQNMGIRVRHVNLDRMCTIDEVMDAILMRLSPSGPRQEYRFIETRLMLEVEKLRSKIVLILDNIDCHTLSEESRRDKLKGVLWEILRKSNGFMHLILTSQYEEFNINWKDQKRIKLYNLTLEHSVEMLTKLSPRLTVEEALSLVAYTDGIPLALDIVASLLGYNHDLKVNDLLLDLSADPMGELSTEKGNEKLSRIFSIATNYLSENDRACFVVVSLFPSSFTKDTATVLLPHFVSDTTCLERLQQRSLVEYNKNVRRYHLLTLLQQHGNKIRPRHFKVTKFLAQLTLYHMQHTLEIQEEQRWILDHHLWKETHTIRYLLDNFNTTKASIASIGDVGVVVRFATKIFYSLPFYHPILMVETFWEHVQDMCRGTLAEGFSKSACQVNFPDCLKFQLQLHKHVSFRANMSRAFSGQVVKDTNTQANKLRVFSVQDTNTRDLQLTLARLVESGCVDVSDIVKLLVYAAKYEEERGNAAAYIQLIKMVQSLRSHINTLSSMEKVAEYDTGIFLYELGEYELAIEFLQACSNTSKRSQAIKLIVELYEETGRLDEAKEVIKSAKGVILQQANDFLARFKVISSINYTAGMDEAKQAMPLVTMFSSELRMHGESVMDLIDMILSLNNSELATGVIEVMEDLTLKTNQFVDNVSDAEVNLKFHLEEQCALDREWTVVDICQVVGRLYADVLQTHFKLSLLLAKLVHILVKCDFQLGLNISTDVDHVLKAFHQKQNQFLLHHIVELKVLRSILPPEEMLEVLKERLMDTKEGQQLQYSQGEFLALFYAKSGKLEQAKATLSQALRFLVYVDIDRKVHRLLQLQFLSARIQYSLGHYSTALQILKNCSLTISESNLRLPLYTDPAGKQLMRSYYEVIPPELSMILDLSVVVKRTLFNKLEALKYSHTEEILLFAVIYVTLFVLMLGSAVSVVDGHYLVYLLYTSRNPLCKLYHLAPCMDSWGEVSFLSLRMWTTLPSRIQYIFFTFASLVVGITAYYVHWHLYFILVYLKML